jgi:tetratricopeptide (TPR) repeat protein
MVKWILAAVSFFNVFAIAAQPQIDSLKFSLERTQGTMKLDLFRELIKCTIDSNTERALEYSREAVKYALQVDDTFRMLRTFRIHGMILERVGLYDSAIILLGPLLPIAKRNEQHDEEFRILNIIGCANISLGKSDAALECFLKCTASFANHSEIADVYNNIGLVFYKLRDFKVALTYFKKSIANNMDGRPPLPQLSNIALASIALNEYDSAGIFFKQIWKDIDQAEPADLCAIFFGKGVLMFNLNELDSSRFFLEEAFCICSQIADQRMKAESARGLAAVYMKKGAMQRANELLNQSQAIAIENGIDELLINIYKDRIAFYQETRNYKQLVDYNGRYISLTAKLRAKIVLDNTKNYLVKIVHHENVRTLRAQQKIIAEQMKSAERNETIRYIVSCMTFLLVFVVCLLFKDIRYKKRLKSRLTKTVLERSKYINAYMDELKMEKADLDRISRETAEKVLMTMETTLAKSETKLPSVVFDIFSNFRKLVFELEREDN